MAYVSITGLKLKQFYHAPQFWWYAIRSMMQARQAAGNLRAEARTINGVHHTLTVWTDKGAMHRFLISGPHLAAMKIFARIATGKTFGFDAEEVPEWNQVHALWQANGREYRPRD